MFWLLGKGNSLKLTTLSSVPVGCFIDQAIHGISIRATSSSFHSFERRLTLPGHVCLRVIFAPSSSTIRANAAKRYGYPSSAQRGKTLFPLYSHHRSNTNRHHSGCD